MRLPLLNYILAFSVAFSPLLSYATPKQSTQPLNTVCVEAVTEGKKDIRYLEDLEELDEKFVKAIHDYLKAPENRSSNKLVDFVAKTAMALSLPIRALTTIPVGYTIRYFRGETRLQNPEKSGFRAYSRKIIVNGVEKEQLIVVKGLPRVMKNQDRKELEQLVAHFKRIGIAKADPKIQRKEFKKRFFDGEFNFLAAIFKMVWRGLNYIWEAGTRRAPRWLFIHSLPLPLPMPAHWRPYRLPLHEDFKNFRMPIFDANGNVKAYKKFKASKSELEVYYLLNKHRRNIIEDLDRWGSDLRAAAVLTFVYFAISDFINFRNSGINEISWGTKWPLVALVSSRLIAAVLNKLQNGFKPAITLENGRKFLAKARVGLNKLYIKYLKREKVDPTAFPENVFDKYVWDVENDDYFEKAIIAFFGHEPIKRDGAVVWRTKTIGKNIGKIIENNETIKLEALTAFQKYLRDVKGLDLEINEIEKIFAVVVYRKRTPPSEFSGPQTTQEIAEIGIVHKKTPPELIEDGEVIQAKIPGDITGDSHAAVEALQELTAGSESIANQELLEIPLSDGGTAIEETITKFPGAPAILIADLSDIDGINHQLTENLGFQEVLLTPKGDADKGGSSKGNSQMSVPERIDRVLKGMKSNLPE